MITRVPRVLAAQVEPVGDSAVVEQGRPRAPAGCAGASGTEMATTTPPASSSQPRPGGRSFRVRQPLKVAELRPRVSRIPVFRATRKPPATGAGSRRTTCGSRPSCGARRRVRRRAGVCTSGLKGRPRCCSSVRFHAFPNCARFTGSMSSGRFIAPVNRSLRWSWTSIAYQPSVRICSSRGPVDPDGRPDLDPVPGQRV